MASVKVWSKSVQSSELQEDQHMYLFASVQTVNEHWRFSAVVSGNGLSLLVSSAPTIITAAVNWSEVCFTHIHSPVLIPL